MEIMAMEMQVIKLFMHKADDWIVECDGVSNDG